MTEKTKSAATMSEEGLAATCGGIARYYLVHRGHEVRTADGLSCDGENAPIVATDGDETVLVAVISAYEEGSARMPELSVSAAEFAIMKCACLLYLADHGSVDAIRHDVVSIVVTGNRQANLRHPIVAWQWAESREWPGTSDHEDRPRPPSPSVSNTWRRRRGKDPISPSPWHSAEETN